MAFPIERIGLLIVGAWLAGCAASPGPDRERETGSVLACEGGRLIARRVDASGGTDLGPESDPSDWPVDVCLTPDDTLLMPCGKAEFTLTRAEASVDVGRMLFTADIYRGEGGAWAAVTHFSAPPGQPLESYVHTSCLPACEDQGVEEENPCESFWVDWVDGDSEYPEGDYE